MNRGRRRCASGLASLAVFLLAHSVWAQSLTLVDGDGAVWDLDESTGAVVSGSGEAFDGFGQLSIDGVPYANPGGAAAVTEEADGRLLIFPAATLSGLTVERQVYVSPTDPLCRYVEALTNATASDVTVDITFEGILGAGDAAEVRSTSSGDRFATADDTWFVMDMTGAGDPPAVGVLFRGPGPRRPASIRFAEDGLPAPGHPAITWEAVTIPAGTTTHLVAIVTQQDEPTNAANLLALVEGLNEKGSEELSDLAVSSLHNFSLAPGVLGTSTLEIGLNAGGSLILPSLDVGLRPVGDDDWLVTPPGHESWTLVFLRGDDSYTVANGAPVIDDALPLYMSSRTSVGASVSATQRGEAGGIAIEQTLRHDEGGGTQIVVELTNVGVGPVTSLRYMRVVNAEPDLAPRGIAQTNNNVIKGVGGGVVVVSEGPMTGRTLMMASVGTTSLGAVVEPPLPPDPEVVLADPFDPGGRASDAAMVLLWPLLDLAEGASAEIEMWYHAAETEDDALAVADGLGLSVPGMTDRDDDGHPFPDDCDDSVATVFPGAEEVCNEVDDDCDDEVDNVPPTTYYRDADEDGYGTVESTQELACAEVPEGYVEIAGDCNDSSALTNPDGEEVCNGRDDDCNGETDEGITTVYYSDADEDGFGDDEGAVEVGCEGPPVGYVIDGGDCDDAIAEINPEAEEVCDDADNDCDGVVDGVEGCEGSGDGGADAGSDAGADAGADSSVGPDGGSPRDGGRPGFPDSSTSLRDNSGCSCSTGSSARPKIPALFLLILVVATVSRLRRSTVL